MKIRKAEFVISAVKTEQYPEGEKPDIAFVGRSNVGKSSLLNALVNRRHLAKWGKTPGVTALVNFFNINDEIHLVDLPGYGYAASAKGERDIWANIINTYLEEREQLSLIMLLVDVRHEPSKDDCVMYNWLRYSEIPHAVIVTKSDKVKRSQLNKQLAMIRKTLQAPENIPVIPISSEKKDGIDKVWNLIEETIGRKSDEM